MELFDMLEALRPKSQTGGQYAQYVRHYGEGEQMDGEVMLDNILEEQEARIVSDMSERELALTQELATQLKMCIAVWTQARLSPDDTVDSAVVWLALGYAGDWFAGGLNGTEDVS